MTNHFQNSCKFMIVYVNLFFNMVLVFFSYSGFLLKIMRILINKRLCSYIAIIKDTGKARPQIKLMLTKNINMYIWRIGTVEQLFVRSSCTHIKFSKKRSSQW